MSAKHAAFARLKPVCSALLELRQDGKGLAAKLRELLSIVTTEDPQGLQACKDYVLFPLLMIVDAAVLSRGLALNRFFPPICPAAMPIQFSADFPRCQWLPPRSSPLSKFKHPKVHLLVDRSAVPLSQNEEIQLATERMVPHFRLEIAAGLVLKALILHLTIAKHKQT